MATWNSTVPISSMARNHNNFRDVNFREILKVELLLVSEGKCAM